MSATQNRDATQRRYPFVIAYNMYDEMIITSYTTFKTHLVSPEELCNAVAKDQMEWPLILIMNNVALAYDETFTSETKGNASIEHVLSDEAFNGHDSYTVVLSNPSQIQFNIRHYPWVT